MLGHARHGGLQAHSGKVVVLVVLAKLALVVGALALLGFGAGRVAGAWVVAAHVVVLAVAAAVLTGAYMVGDRARHGALLDTTSHRAGDHAKGIILHDAAGYDRLVRLLTLGREGRLRALMLRPAGLCPGEAVLDVACGTGTLAIAAKRWVGPTGSVTGLDASAAMVERAQAKAEAAGLDLTFVQGAAQELPFEDQRFDIVMGTLMLHHLPKPTRAAFAREARRVLKPGGRLLVVDFGRPAQRSRLPRLHRHGHVDLEVIGRMLAESGFEIAEMAEVGTKDLRYVLAHPAGANKAAAFNRPGVATA